MADHEAEMAQLNSMQDGNEVDGISSSEQHAGDVSDDDYEPSQTVHIESPIRQEDPTSNTKLNASSLPTYDSAIPQSDTTLASTLVQPQGTTDSQVPSRTSSRASAPETVKSRTIGGFIVDDDEDDVAGSPLQQDGASGLRGGFGDPKQHSRSQTPGHEVSKNGLSIQNSQVQGSDGVLSSVAHGLSNSAALVSQSDALSKNDRNSNTNQVSNSPQLKVSSTQATATTTPDALTPIATLPTARLPHDRIGILEDRIKEDPRGDMDAWLDLISEHQRRNKLDDARSVYDRFFEVFPTAAEQWVSYASMESQDNDLYRLEQIFRKSLLDVPHVLLWSFYLDYIRRRNNLTTDPDGRARQTISQAYDFALKQVGVDKDSGQLWQDYVHFIRTGPGVIGGGSWQDQQKMDLLRKTYQQAICIPTQAVNALWKEYDQFEMGLNKLTGRKFLQEKSPAYMSARSSYTELHNFTKDLHRTTLPRLPPTPGFDGDTDYLKQLDIWKRWIQWEKYDPLVLKEEDPAAYRTRIIHVYLQALMAMRFWPELWFDAAEFCFSQGMEEKGKKFLDQGLAANPESCLLAFKKADRLETTTTNDEGDEGIKMRGALVREPYDKVLDALYDLIGKVKTREAQDIAQIEKQFAENDGQSLTPKRDDDDEDKEYDNVDSREASKKAQIETVQKATAPELAMLSKTISFAWIALMRAMRRIQGKGKIGDSIGGSRQIFADARKRGRITSDVYLASALIEYHCYKDPAATKIFERGMRLFPEDENFALEHLKHLMAINDITNARLVFTTTVNRLEQKPETLPKAKPIYSFFHEYESSWGELEQVAKLEKRMSELFPEDLKLAHFSRRFTVQDFDPTSIRPIISRTQSKPRAELPIEQRQSPAPNSPLPKFWQATNSPKRPLNADESDSESGRPRKLVRGDSPMRSAPPVRQNQQRRPQQVNGPSYTFTQPVMPPPTLPREILNLLTIIPKASTYHATKFVPEKMLDLLRRTNLPATPPVIPQQSRPPPMSMPPTQIPPYVSSSYSAYPLPNQPFNPSNLRQQYPPPNMPTVYPGQRPYP
ncbi:MAG: mRNA 3'-end-processing protein rna14 [Cirrosporium novae-zelandiae]|nr:MAG: mRNA 3'-end-processing protein rna14 [Cirrosporium novae-zelandiae]